MLMSAKNIFNKVEILGGLPDYRIPSMTRLISHLPLLVTALLGITSCSTTERPTGPKGNFSVKVVPFFGKDVTVYISAYERKPDGTSSEALVNRKVTDDGVTGFVLPADGVYDVRAYADIDKDGKCGPNDPTATVEGLKPHRDLAADLEPTVLTLPGMGVAPDWPGGRSGAVPLTTTPGASGNLQTGLDKAGAAAPGVTPDSENAEALQKAADKVQTVAPSLPIPPLPVPPPPK